MSFDAANNRSYSLVERGLSELALLIRAVCFNSSQPLILLDDNRRCLDASFGTGRLLGLSRDAVIAGKIDDLVAPAFKSQIDSRWQQFLEQGDQADTFPLLVAGKTEHETGYLARSHILPGHHQLVLSAESLETSSRKAQAPVIPSWVRDCALVVLDTSGSVAAWYSGAERIYGYTSGEMQGKHVSALYEDQESAKG